MLTAGSLAGYYEIVGPIGAGGMGEVYRARDSRLRRDVAIKILPTGPRLRFLLTDGRVKLLDFGLAKLLGVNKAIAEENKTEQRHYLTSAGSVVKEDPPSLDDLPSGAMRVVQHALEKSPANRFQTAKDFAFALEATGSSDSNRSLPAKRNAAESGAEPIGSVVPSEPPLYRRMTFRRGRRAGSSDRKKERLAFDGAPNSSAPAYCGRYIGENYVETADARGLTRGEIERIARNSFDANSV